MATQRSVHKPIQGSPLPEYPLCAVPPPPPQDVKMYFQRLKLVILTIDLAESMGSREIYPTPFPRSRSGVKTLG